MLEKMKLWWKFEGRHYHKDFIQGVKNLYKWFPTIWKDRDWDGHYIYEILRVKLENQAYCIGNESRHVNSKRDVERMLLCSRLIQIQQEDLYEIEYLDYIKEDHHMIPTDETRQWYTIESTTIEDNLDEYFEKYPKQYKQVQLGKINYFGGSLLMIKPKKECNLNKIIYYLNSEEFKENFIFSERFKIGHRQLSNSYIPKELIEYFS